MSISISKMMQVCEPTFLTQLNDAKLSKPKTKPESKTKVWAHSFKLLLISHTKYKYRISLRNLRKCGSVKSFYT